MLQSMVLQRVGHDLATEKKNTHKESALSVTARHSVGPAGKEDRHDGAGWSLSALRQISVLRAK